MCYIKGIYIDVKKLIVIVVTKLMKQGGKNNGNV